MEVTCADTVAVNATAKLSTHPVMTAPQQRCRPLLWQPAGAKITG